MRKDHGLLLLPVIGPAMLSLLVPTGVRVVCDQSCRRRLPVVMVRLKMSENLQEAVTFIEQVMRLRALSVLYVCPLGLGPDRKNWMLCKGHVRVGPEVVTDPAFLVTRYTTRRI